MKYKGIIETLARGVCVKGDRVLLCHSKGADNTFLPGGHVEFGESAAEALRRELQEEMGLEARIGRYLGTVEHSFDQSGTRHCEVNLLFEMDLELDPGLDPPSREKRIEFRWTALAELEAVRLEPAPLRRALPDWLARGEASERWASTY